MARRRRRIIGFSKLTRVKSKKQAVYGHAITHSRSYQKGVGVKQARREHAFFVRHYLKKPHPSPFKAKVKGKPRR